ncbi:MAG: hypothetical protein KGL42_08605 [Betaproteobacteria bacterium]|nr:hypothetical protein [Betaproteobacteria bacterium]
MKTAHRQAARAKAARKYTLIDPATETARCAEDMRQRRKGERPAVPPDAWQAAWQPLAPAPAPVRRPGADDYLRHPSRVGERRMPYHVAQPSEAAPCPTRP